MLYEVITTQSVLDTLYDFFSKKFTDNANQASGESVQPARIEHRHQAPLLWSDLPLGDWLAASYNFV